jgi:hypothetical protein
LERFWQLSRDGGNAPGFVARSGVMPLKDAELRSWQPQLLLTQHALRVGQGPLAGTLVGYAISFTSPRHGRLYCLYLLRRYLTKFGLRRRD